MQTGHIFAGPSTPYQLQYMNRNCYEKDVGTRLGGRLEVPPASHEKYPGRNRDAPTYVPPVSSWLKKDEPSRKRVRGDRRNKICTRFSRNRQTHTEKSTQTTIMAAGTPFAPYFLRSVNSVR